MTICYSNNNRKLIESDGVNMGLTSKLFLICKVLPPSAQHAEYRIHSSPDMIEAGVHTTRCFLQSFGKRGMMEPLSPGPPDSSLVGRMSRDFGIQQTLVLALQCHACVIFTV